MARLTQPLLSALSAVAITGALLQAQSRAGTATSDARFRDRAFVMGARAIVVRADALDGDDRNPVGKTDRAAIERKDEKKDDKKDAGARLVVDTRGSELLIVRVALPATMRWDKTEATRRVQYRVVVSRYVQVVGSTSGYLDASRDSSLVLALRLSRRAPAGRSLAGTVEFTLGSAVAQVAIDADVPVMRRVALSVPPQGLAATRGRWNQLSFRVSNDGNVSETPAIRVDAPSEWRVEVRQLESSEKSSRAIPAGTSRMMALRVWIPSGANHGTVMMPLQLARPDSTPLVLQVPVDVLPDVGGTAVGPTITTSYVAGQSGTDATMQGYGVAIGGQLSDSLRVSGRFSYAGTSPTLGGAGFALARAGVLTTPPSLELEHPRAQLSAGATSGAFPELGGQYLTGLGGVGRVRRGALQVRAFDLRPLSLQQQFTLSGHAPGRFSGGEIGIDRDRARMAVFGTSLDDPTTGRALDAWGLRGGIGHALGSSLSSEVAYRSHATGRGLGIATSARLVGMRSTLDVRAMHAPGGSRAFARASDEILASATRMFGRRSYVSVGGWTQRDDNLTVGAAQNRGWYVTPTFALGRATSIGLEARGQSFSAGTEQGRIGTDELAGGGTLNLTIAGIQFTGRSALSQMNRRVGVLDLGTLTSRQWRLDHMVLASRTGLRGSISVSYMRQQYNAEAGAMPGQQSMSARVDRFRPFLTKSLLIDAEWQRMQMGRSVPASTIARASVSVPLVAGMRVAVGIERNPFMSLATTRGQSPLLYSLRLDRSTTLPRLFSSAHGLVFRDENGNGRRDRGERGVAGVVVLCGAGRVASDKNGRYACSQSRHEVDARTIPTGLVATRPKVENGEAIALRVVQPLHITLRVPSVDSARLSSTVLSQVIVSARDTSGYAWRARALGDGRYVVDALPVGRYDLVMDASSAEEPLTLAGTAPTIVIDANGVAPDVALDVRPRPLRMRTFAPSTPDAAAMATPSTKSRTKRKATSSAPIRNAERPRQASANARRQERR